MRSASEDLTTRARVRDAAIELFGRNGFNGTSVRAIAERAGVSAALVIHHFGSKNDLRAACDAHLVAQLVADKSSLNTADPAPRIEQWLANPETFQPLIDYVSRMLTSDNPAADELFDALRAGTREMLNSQIAAGTMREPLDLDVTALYMTMYGLTPLLMRHQMNRALGVEATSLEGLAKTTLPLLDFYTHGIYSDDRVLKAAQSALHQPPAGTPEHSNLPDYAPDPPARADHSNAH